MKCEVCGDEIPKVDNRYRRVCFKLSCRRLVQSQRCRERYHRKGPHPRMTGKCRNCGKRYQKRAANQMFCNEPECRKAAYERRKTIIRELNRKNNKYREKAAV